MKELNFRINRSLEDGNSAGDTSTLGGERSVAVFKKELAHKLSFSFINGNVADFTVGQIVCWKTNKFQPVSDGTDIPIGIITVGAKQTRRATMLIFASALVEGVASSGAAIATGVFIRQTGNVDSSGRPEYVLAGSGKYADGFCLVGGNASTPVVAMVLQQSKLMP